MCPVSVSVIVSSSSCLWVLFICVCTSLAYQVFSDRGPFFGSLFLPATFFLPLLG